MLMHPSQNKGAYSEPTSIPFSYTDAVHIQDDQFFPEYSQEIPFQYLRQEQPRLQSAFEYRQGLNFVSPPSSVPSSPASSVSHLPGSTAVAADYSSAVFDGSNFEAPSMTPASSYNPSIDGHHSGSPLHQSYLPQYHPPQFVFDNSPMLTQQYIPNNHTWEQNLHSLQTPNSSSGRSPGNTIQQHSAHYSAPTKPLPTPVHTPLQQQSFLTPQYQKNDLSSHDGSQPGLFMADQQQNHSQHQHQTSDYSLAPSVSTVSHNSPATPLTGFEDEEIPKPVHNDYSSSNGLPLGIPKLNRTITDVYQDELYNPMQAQQAAKQPSHQQNLLPSYQNPLNDRLKAANQGHMSARNRSPMGSIHRDRSPFRQNSPLAAEYENDAFRQPPAVTSVPNAHPMQQTQIEQPKTISPKDAVLHDFDQSEDHQLPYLHQPDFNLGDTLGLRQENTFQPAPSFPSMESLPQFSQAQGPSQQFVFSQPQQGRRQSQQQNSLLHQTPEFPATLPRFESTGSDAFSNGVISPSISKTTGIPQRGSAISRPQDTSADAGTYTCTYHGCTQRFETPNKLQKHKREAHRQTTPGGHQPGRDGSSRNSQAGPHRCDRINPQTGKPCGSIFSRPYDLTRHEDTIHNARKQKVRCHLCTEEKTFSRNDALTRHMRVVHPEVDWPGKQRRRGRD
ncbi:hypothetical protein BJY01DRAFT_203979 [Aspergillus pseudoustus]|uniref:C2H2-type domain-containing protein n=1 Tax=Aspergillus pseudoustus TaxID=1810923 RepID=A0ABR4KUD8_9EURO